MKCLSLQGLTVQTRFLHLLSKEWDNCSQFLPVDYGDLGDSPGVRCPPEILSACLDGYLSDVRDVSIQVNKTFKGLVVQKQLPAPVQLSDWGRTSMEEGSLQQAIQEIGEGTKVGESLSWQSHMMPLTLREARNSGSGYIGACCSPALLKAQPTLEATTCCLLAVKSSRGRQVGVTAGVAADGHCSASVSWDCSCGHSGPCS